MTYLTDLLEARKKIEERRIETCRNPLRMPRCSAKTEGRYQCASCYANFQAISILDTLIKKAKEKGLTIEEWELIPPIPLHRARAKLREKIDDKLSYFSAGAEGTAKSLRINGKGGESCLEDSAKQVEPESYPDVKHSHPSLTSGSSESSSKPRNSSREAKPTKEGNGV